MNTILCGIGRFRGVLLLFGVVGVLSICCRCTPAAGKQPWSTGSGTSSALVGTTTSPLLLENTLVQVEQHPSEAPSPPPELPASTEPAEPAPHPASARVPGEGSKYSGLLRKIKVEKDQGSYGEFYDYGYWSGTAWAGYKDLPPGYWVYVAPNWYIFGSTKGVKAGQNPAKLG